MLHPRVAVVAAAVRQWWVLLQRHGDQNERGEGVEAALHSIDCCAGDVGAPDGGVANVVILCLCCCWYWYWYCCCWCSGCSGGGGAAAVDELNEQHNVQLKCGGFAVVHGAAAVVASQYIASNTWVCHAQQLDPLCILYHDNKCVQTTT